MIQIACPRCQRTLVYQDQHAGMQGQCDGCGTLITIPASVIPPFQSSGPTYSSPQPQSSGNSALDSLASMSAPGATNDQYQSSYSAPHAQHQSNRGHYRGGGESHFGMAIAGFILSLLIPLLGLIFSAIAVSSIKKSNNKEGQGFAQAGLIISIVLLVLSCLWGIVVFGVFARHF